MCSKIIGIFLSIFRFSKYYIRRWNQKPDYLKNQCEAFTQKPSDKRERVYEDTNKNFRSKNKAIRCWPTQSKNYSRVNRKLCMGITFCARQSKRRVRSKLDEDKPSLNSSHFQMHLGHGVFASRTRISREKERVVSNIECLTDCWHSLSQNFSLIRYLCDV